MGKVVFGMIASLDGFISDRHGTSDWGQMDEDLHRLSEAEEAKVGINIYGRRMYETMAVWDALAEDQSASQMERDFGMVWRNTDKIVVSRSLGEVTTSRTRLVREVTAADIAQLKASSDRDISVSGATLAGHFFAQGLIDELQMYIAPLLVGGGKPLFQGIGDTIPLRRLEQLALDSGVTFIRYGVVR